MKRLTAVLLSALCVLTVFAGCGNKSGNTARINYNYDMSEYITLGDYKSIKIDKESDTYKNYYDSQFESEISSASLYDKKTEGVIANGDMAVIEYVGRIDGEEFEGGSTTEETLLTVGAGGYIDGFEDALIGKEIGKETVINVTFPDEYSLNQDLAGKPAEFTVSINYVNVLPELTDELAVKLGYENKDKYIEHLNEAATENYVYTTLLSLENMAIKSYPETEKARYDEMYNECVAQAEKVAAENNTDVNTAFYQLFGTTPEYVEYYYNQYLSIDMVMYAVYDAENLSYTEEEYNAKLEELASSEGITVDEFKNLYPAWRCEAIIVQQVVIEHLAKLATAE